jgi:hypothetical protein
LLIFSRSDKVVQARRTQIAFVGNPCGTAAVADGHEFSLGEDENSGGKPLSNSVLAASGFSSAASGEGQGTEVRLYDMPLSDSDILNEFNHFRHYGGKQRSLWTGHELLGTRVIGNAHVAAIPNTDCNPTRLLPPYYINVERKVAWRILLLQRLLNQSFTLPITKLTCAPVPSRVHRHFPSIPARSIRRLSLGL